MKKILSLVLVLIMCFSLVPMTDLGMEASATSKTQDEAISWAQSQVEKSIDTDGYPSGQPYQCVDFIKAYYSYLGVNPVSGNGSDYTWNSLPSGWQRIQGAQPQKGDILVYTGGYNNYGHVAIYESDRSHYHQNIDNCYYVKKATYKYNGLSTPYWGVIRPNWSQNTDSYFTGLWHGEVSETNARIDATINLTYIQQCGFYYGTSTSNMARVVEDTYANTLNIWFNFNEYGITLSPGTTYYYKIFIVVNGNEYQTATQYFTTIGHSHSYSSSVTTEPTCKKEGVRTYKCSCGASYTEAITKKSHSIVTIPAVSSTCTKTGLTEGKKCSVCGTVTVDQQNVAKKAHTEITDNAVVATCTKTGLTEGKHCSVCGTVTVAQTTTPQKSHTDNNFDGKCDSCGISSSSDDLTEKNCVCNCHKGGIAGFFFKLINFFEKLFGKNKICECGVKH